MLGSDGVHAIEDDGAEDRGDRGFISDSCFLKILRDMIFEVPKWWVLSLMDCA